MTKFKGKVVGGAIYAHKSTIPALGLSFVEKSEVASSIVKDGTHWNVVKFDQKDQNKLSLLLYEDFAKAEFPALLQFSSRFSQQKISVSNALKIQSSYFASQRTFIRSVQSKKRRVRSSHKLFRRTWRV